MILKKSIHIMNNNQIIKLKTFLFVCFIYSFSIFPLYSFAQNESNDRIIALTNNCYMQPYTFEYGQNKNEIVLGIVWVQLYQNNSEQVLFKSYNGIEFSESIPLSNINEKESLFSPKATMVNRELYVCWIEKSKSSYFNIVLINRSESGVWASPDIIIFQRNSSNSEQPAFIDLELSLFTFQNRLYLIWTEQDGWLHYLIYELDNTKKLEIYPLSFVWYDINWECKGRFPEFFQYHNALYIRYLSHVGWGAEPFSRYFIAKLNQSNPCYINMTPGSDDFVSMIYISTTTYGFDDIRYESIDIIDFNNSLSISLPLQGSFDPNIYAYNSTDNWTVHQDFYGKGNYRQFTIFNGTQGLTKSTISPYGNIIYGCYIDNTSNLNEKLRCMYIEEKTIYDVGIIDDGFICDYGLFCSTYNTKTYLSLNRIINPLYDQLYCIWVCKSNETNKYYLYLKEIIKHPTFRVELQMSKEIAYTNESIIFLSTTYSPTRYYYTYYYSFGDNNFRFWDTNGTSEHVYKDHMEYSVKVIVKNEFGLECYDAGIVTIHNRPPIALAYIKSVEYITGSVIQFFQNCSDSDGSIVGYHWDFGDNQTNDSSFVSHIYLDNGIYYPRLTITDDDGAENSTNMILVINNRRPIADFNIVNQKGTVLEDFIFNSTCIDSDGKIVKYFWDFGDGFTSEEPNPKHRYNSKGIFWPALFVIDDDSEISIIARKMVTIENIPPIVELKVSSSTVLTFEQLKFLASATDTDGQIAFYFWDFGDSTNGTGQKIIHEYRDDGNYNVTLRVVDNNLAENVTTVQITVLNRAPSLNTNIKPRALTGEKLSLDASNSFDRDGKIISWRWSIDGRNLDGERLNWSFQSPGKHTVNISITDDDGAITEQTYDILAMEANTNTGMNNWMFITILIIAGVIIAGIWKRIYKSSLFQSK